MNTISRAKIKELLEETTSTHIFSLLSKLCKSKATGLGLKLMVANKVFYCTLQFDWQR